MDNHANTHCFGKNFVVLDYTRQKCSVAPFLAEYDETQDIDIVTGATAVDLHLCVRSRSMVWRENGKVSY